MKRLGLLASVPALLGATSDLSDDVRVLATLRDAPGFQAVVAKDKSAWCDATASIWITGPSAAAFSQNQPTIERLIGGIRSILSFECPQATAVSLTGIATEGGEKGAEVYSALAQASNGWVLEQGAEPARPTRQATSTVRDDEVGYVTNGAIVLRPHPVFSAAARNVSSAADREHSRWRTCMSGLDFGKLFTLSRGQQNDYRRNPARYCGAEPRGTSTGAAESFVVREAVFSISQGRQLGQSLGRVAFSEAADTPIPGSAGWTGKCLVLTNASGQLIPVRSSKDRDPYTFSNPYEARSDPVDAARGQLESLTSRASNTEAQYEQARSNLTSSSAWRGGQCVKPAQAPLPPRPQTYSEAQIETAAKGFCVDMAMRRHNEAYVIGALRSAYMDKEGWLTAQQAWAKGKPLGCEFGAMRSQVDDQMIRIFGMFTQFGGYGAVQDATRQCASVVRSRCGADLSAWSEQVRRVQAGPIAELSQCQASLTSLSQSKSAYASYQQQIAQAQANLRAAESAPKPQAQLAGLSQARCR